MCWLQHAGAKHWLPFFPHLCAMACWPLCMHGLFTPRTSWSSWMFCVCFTLSWFFYLIFVKNSIGGCNSWNPVSVLLTVQCTWCLWEKINMIYHIYIVYHQDPQPAGWPAFIYVALIHKCSCHVSLMAGRLSGCSNGPCCLSLLPHWLFRNFALQLTNWSLKLKVVNSLIKYLGLTDLGLL